MDNLLTAKWKRSILNISIWISMTLEDFCEDEMEHFFLFMNLDMGKQYILKSAKEC